MGETTYFSLFKATISFLIFLISTEKQASHKPWLTESSSMGGLIRY